MQHCERTFELLVARAAAEPKLQSGVHSYELEDFGVTESDLRRELGAYSARFGLHVG